MNKSIFIVNVRYCKYFLAILAIFIVDTSILKAQNTLFQTDQYALRLATHPKTDEFLLLPNTTNVIEPLTFLNSTRIDTVFKPKLLPDNISFMEKLVWGDNGIVRGIGLASPLTIEVRRHELNVRRTMLTAHLIGGFTTLGLMVATCYYGQRIIDGGVDGRRNYESTKNTLVAATITSYTITALLSVLSPPPLVRRDEFSTTTLHKTLAWVHVAGMIITPILGSLINTNRAFNIDKAHYHQISGYITTLVFATAMFVITL